MGKITSLLRRITAFVPFRRNKAGANETSETESSSGDNPQDIQALDKTIIKSKSTSIPEKDAEVGDTAEPKPGIWRKITARIKQLFTRRNAANAADESSEETLTPQKKRSVPEEIIEEDQSEGAPKKRRIPIKKLIIIGLPVLILILASTVASMMIIDSNTKQKKAAAIEEKHQKALQAELKKLQEKNHALLEENKKLLSAPAQPAPSIDITQNAPPTTHNEAPVAASTPALNNSKPATSIGDCAVTNKESAGESLKRCIEAYNAASSRK